VRGAPNTNKNTQATPRMTQTHQSQNSQENPTAEPLNRPTEAKESQPKPTRSALNA